MTTGRRKFAVSGFVCASVVIALQAVAQPIRIADCADILDKDERLACYKVFTPAPPAAQKPDASTRPKKRTAEAKAAPTKAPKVQPLTTEQQLALAGEEPKRSSYDGTYLSVKWFLKENMGDPASLKLEYCTQAYLSSAGWATQCTYRGKNGFGGMVKETNWFIVRKNAAVMLDRQP